MRRFAGIKRAQPVKFFLSVAIGSLEAAPTCKSSDLPQRQQNIRVAKALGLAIPDALLVRATELIE